MKKCLFLLALLSLGLSQSKAQDAIFNDTLRLNQIRVLGSHNSYKKPVDKGIMRALSIINPFFKQRFSPAQMLDYSHLPIDSQLENYGIRSLELDIYYDPVGGRYYKRTGNFLAGKSTNSHEQRLLEPGFKVMHISDIDYNTWYLQLKDALQCIQKWSLQHPTHIPIFVMLELKEDGVGNQFPLFGFKKALSYDLPALLTLKQEIENIFPYKSQQILYPDDVCKPGKSLRESIETDGWPSLGDSRGKIVFIIMSSGPLNKIIHSQFPSFKGLPFFAFANMQSDEAAFIKVDDAIGGFDMIREAIKKGFIVRTRTDAGTVEARKNDYSIFFMANKSGAQILSTDYYVPFPLNGFVIKSNMLNLAVGH